MASELTYTPGTIADGDKGDITVSTGGSSWTVDSGTITLAKMADMATSSVFYRKTAGTGAPEVQTLATLKTDLGLTGTNSGDQTSIVGITGTKSQFDTAVTDGNFLYVGDVTQYTDEMAQDAVGAMIDSSLTYVDATPLLQRAALTGDVTASAGSNTVTVTKINGTSLAGLATGILKNTTSTGVPSIATAGTDYVAPSGALGTPSSGTLTNCTGLPVSGITSSTSTALGVGSLELGNASDTTLSRSSAGVLAVEGVVIPSISSTNTLTNKRITKRVSTTTSSATPTINTDNVDMYGLTAQTVDITSFTTNLSGTPTDGQTLWIYIVGTAARAITWGSSFESSTVTLPTTTVSTNRLDVGFVWNAATSKWRCVASS